MSKLHFCLFTFITLLFNTGFSQRFPAFTFENQCFGNITYIYLYNRGIVDVMWDFGDPITGENNTSTEIDPKHVFSATGSYNITLTGEVATTGIDQNGNIIYGTQKVTYNETVTIYPVPVVEPLVDLVQCETDLNGFSQFNLNEVVDKISTNVSNETFTFYKSETDAISGKNEIVDPISYTNTVPNSDIVWVRVEDISGFCFNTSQVNLKVVNTQIPNNFTRNFSACDGLDGNDTNGISVFDFSSVHDEILNMFPNPQDLEINYYTSESDALSEINPIKDIHNYINTDSPYNQDIYVRVDNSIYNNCIGLGKHIRLIVNPSPDFYIEPMEIYCVSDPNYTLVLDPVESNSHEEFNYSWTLNGNIIATSPILTVNNPGEYSITLTKRDGTGCSRTKTVFVVASEIASFDQKSIDVVELSENNSITITNPLFLGAGDYRFELESEDGLVYYPYQNEPVFNNLKGGIYTLTVEEKNGCGRATLQISVIGYPKFFTPNDDGINDFWQIQGINNLIQSNSSIYIFDRYGKLLKQLSPFETGWNGTFNGHRLASDDYWFKLSLQDGRTFLGHFALKR